VSRRANILLLLTLAAGVAYGWFGVPFFLTILADDSEGVTEELGDHRLSEVEQAEVDDLRCRMLSLKTGMDKQKVSKVLGLLIYATLAYEFDSNGGDGWPPWSEDLYRVGQRHALMLRYDYRGLGLAELHNRDGLVARVPSASTVRTLDTASVWKVIDVMEQQRRVIQKAHQEQQRRSE
jgi:hypothetical protein